MLMFLPSVDTPCGVLIPQRQTVKHFIESTRLCNKFDKLLQVCVSNLSDGGFTFVEQLTLNNTWNFPDGGVWGLPGDSTEIYFSTMNRMPLNMKMRIILFQL